MDPKSLIAIGKFGKTRGVSGDIYVIPYGDDPGKFTRLAHAILKIDGKEVSINIERGKLWSGRVTVKVKGYDTPEAARTLTHRELFIRPDQLEKLPEGRYYAFDLEGCLALGESGETIGTVIEVESMPGNDLFVIKAPNGQTGRLPVIKQFVKRVDIENKTIVIDPPNGWLDAQ